MRGIPLARSPVGQPCFAKRFRMIRGIYHSAAGMLPRYLRLASLSNNLANSSTHGYKADRRYFSTLLNNEIVQGGPWGEGTRIGDLEEGFFTEFEQAHLEKDNVPTHLAVNGPGFFKLENPDTGEIQYTRNGTFRLNQQNELVNWMGWNVLDTTSSPIIVDGDKLAVNEVGHVYVDGQHKGNIALVDFDDRSQLVKRGNSMWAAGEEMIEKDAEEGKIVQGSLEASNVNPIEEMVIMIELNRNYESSQKAMIAQDSTVQKAVNNVGKF
ncbi:flagellar hook-basal body complex protein [bacterium]|nr:flagellar hook-basal body complex protein [bacterium]